MVDHSEVAYGTADGNDYVAHEQTYLGFLALVKWSTIIICAILALMAIFHAAGRGKINASQARVLFAAQFAVCLIIGGNWLTP